MAPGVSPPLTGALTIGRILATGFNFLAASRIRLLPVDGSKREVAEVVMAEEAVALYGRQESTLLSLGNTTLALSIGGEGDCRVGGAEVAVVVVVAIDRLSFTGDEGSPLSLTADVVLLLATEATVVLLLGPFEGTTSEDATVDEANLRFADSESTFSGGVGAGRLSSLPTPVLELPETEMATLMDPLAAGGVAVVELLLLAIVVCAVGGSGGGG